MGEPGLLNNYEGICGKYEEICRKYEEICKKKYTPIHGPWDRKIPLSIAYGLSPPAPIQAFRLRKFKKYEKNRRRA